ncbi:unnamed protein product [Dicrocoelium dendriticum]|nr:unnamed protein product [Dicrocoelium dendriticum]
MYFIFLCQQESVQFVKAESSPMACRSLSDTFSHFLAPIQLAEAAVKEDDISKLLPLLGHSKNLNDCSSDQLVTEQSYVNQQAKETLLHFAVHQDAARCVALLSNPPYSWSVDCPNLAGVTPAELAASRGYLPVWYPLASKSESIPPSVSEREFNLSASRSVAEVLIYPHIFVKQPLDLTTLVETSVALGANELTMRNLALLLELWLATPTIIREDESCKLHFWSPPPPPANPGTAPSHPTDCQNYPFCLAPQEDLFLPVTARFQSIFDAWAFHRLHHRSDLTDSHSDTYTRCPPTLLEFCRINIRRILVTMLVQLSNLQTKPIKRTNYARLVAKLPIPPFLQAFLAFRDLWPSWKRHMVRIHHVRLTPLPAQHLFLDDPWFPDIMYHQPE